MSAPHAWEGTSRFAGRTAIVTGAAAGIGQAIAGGLAAGGAAVMLVDIDKTGLEKTTEAIKAAGGRAVFAVADVTEEQPVADMVKRTVDALGGVDILVNNVGGSSRGGRIWEQPLEIWQAVIRRNLQSAFLCTRAAVPHMMKKKWGRIIGLSSGASQGTPWRALYRGGADYATAKGGVEAFARHLSLELAEYNITANAVAAGPIETERLRESFRQMESLEYSPIRETPLHRLGQPHEVASAVLYLATEEAGYITGQTIRVTGGR
jgi:NAD(P)-dependent dehydrogenase (short-subunit alcohol dehydrogenase family)